MRLWPGSLRSRFLGVVLVTAVIPLGALGFWLSTNAVRSGEALVRSQIDEALARQAAGVAERWKHRVSDAVLLADNDAVRQALAGDSSQSPAFLSAAFATMPALQSATIRDATGHVRFALGDRPPEGVGRNGGDGAVAPSPTLGLSVPVSGVAGSTAGEVEVRVRISSLITMLADGNPDAPVFAARDRSTGAWLVTPSVPVLLLAESRFRWRDQDWLVARNGVAEPAVDLVMAQRLDPIIAPFARSARAGSIALVIAALVVIIVTIVATLRLTRSLGELAVAADAVAQGDLDRRLDPRGADEVGRVARAFNTMTDNVRRMLRERSQTEALAAMGELAAVLAHQVRSPLTAMRLDLQRVEGRVVADGDKELVGRAIQQLDRLERSVGGALRIAKSASGSFEVVDLMTPLARAVKGVEQEILTRGARLIWQKATRDGMSIRGDASTLEQLFSNILLNAAEATRTGGHVSVQARRENGRALVVIEDSGVGMNPSTLSRIFEPYYSTKPDGTGIGLAVAQRIVMAHGGSIDITSEEGRGTRVQMAFAAPEGQLD